MNARSTMNLVVAATMLAGPVLVGCGGDGNADASSGAASGQATGEATGEASGAAPAGAASGVATGGADASDGATSGRDASGSAAGSGSADSSADGGTGTGIASATAPAPGDLVVATVVGGLAEASTDVNDAANDRGVIAVDGARLATTLGDHTAAEGNVIVAVDYQVFGFRPGNIFDSAFRLLVDGEAFSPVDNLNALAGLGEVLNDTLYFEIPAGHPEIDLEVGLPAGTAGGLTATFGLAFASDPAAAATVAGGVADDVELTVDGGPTSVGIDVARAIPATVTVTGARSTGRSGDLFAGETTKLVVVDVTVDEVGQPANLFDSAFRLRAAGEWYSPRNNVNVLARPGESYQETLVFEVPRQADGLALEAGPPSVLAEVPAVAELIPPSPSALWDLLPA
ncbi:MAG: hypothetical protein ACFCVK_04065 [Acidimicrobiales bacterium]